MWKCNIGVVSTRKLPDVNYWYPLEGARASTGLCEDVSSGVKRDDGRRSSNDALTPQRRPSAFNTLTPPDARQQLRTVCHTRSGCYITAIIQLIETKNKHYNIAPMVISDRERSRSIYYTVLTILTAESDV